jgi:23S rRNA pseudouridine2605 synthase
MFLSLGYKVLKLKRIDYAFLNLKGLSIGEYRPLNIKEVKKLYSLK